jgi:hypothetical protein
MRLAVIPLVFLIDERLNHHVGDPTFQVLQAPLLERRKRFRAAAQYERLAEAIAVEERPAIDRREFIDRLSVWARKLHAGHPFSFLH